MKFHFHKSMILLFDLTEEDRRQWQEHKLIKKDRERERKKLFSLSFRPSFSIFKDISALSMTVYTSKRYDVCKKI